MPNKLEKRRKKNLEKVKTEIKRKKEINLKDVKCLHNNEMENDEIITFIRKNKIFIHPEIAYLMAFT